VAVIAGIWRFVRTPRGAELWDRMKLRLPVVGSIFRAAGVGAIRANAGDAGQGGSIAVAGVENC